LPANGGARRPAPRTEMHPSNVSRHRFRPTLPLLVALAGSASAAACGSPADSGSSEPPTAPDPRAAASPTPSNAGSGGTGAMSNPAPVSRAGAQSEAVTPTPIDPASGESTIPASIDGSAVSDACAALSGSDACASCVCGECSSELAACADTPGCAEILACVRENDCSGSDCYCGDTRLTECVRGEGNGPCKDVVLAAPGGREPTLANPSGGPASDAALDVADCADGDNRCSDVCNIDG
jgi:hypothetical protein